MAIQTKLIRIGNSLGSRYAKADLDRLGLKEGDRVEVVIRKAKPDKAKAIAAMRRIADGNMLANIDVKQWEAERRAGWKKREKQLRDILGH